MWLISNKWTAFFFKLWMSWAGLLSFWQFCILLFLLFLVRRSCDLWTAICFFVSLIWGSFIVVDGQLILHYVCQSVWDFLFPFFFFFSLLFFFFLIWCKGRNGILLVLYDGGDGYISPLSIHINQCSTNKHICLVMVRFFHNEISMWGNL